LVFVGLQIKQDRQIAISGTYQARSDASSELTMSAMTSSEFLGGMAKVYAKNSDDLTMQEAVALEHYWGSILTQIEGNHQQFLLGYLSEEHWQRNIRELECLLDLPLARQFIINWDYRDSFEDVLVELADNAAAQSIGCWSYDWPFAVAE
jgi:hypothetical protein